MKPSKKPSRPSDPAQEAKNSFRDFVLEQLAALPELTCRRMFGGFGLYAGDRFFCIIANSRLYFRTHDATRPEYIARGMEPFRPSERQTLVNYYEVPVDIFEDAAQLTNWAQRAATPPDA